MEADDAVIFAPSAKGLQQLLDICSKFALSHNVVFNVVKSQCLIVSSRSDFIRRPTFQLSGASLPYTECYKYLGHMINSALSDDQDIMKQTRSLYARANVIIRKFSHASLNTKLMLFRAYCSPIYGCQLWSTMFQYSYSKLRVAYNDAFRQLLHEPRWCSASRLFVFHNVSSFSAIIRKLVYSLLCSLRDSNNLLVCAMFHSDICLQSSLFERWHKLLPVHVF